MIRIVSAVLATAFSASATHLCHTASVRGSFYNEGISEQRSGSFSIFYEATPSQSYMDGVFLMSPKAVSSFAESQIGVRFGLSGNIEALNGSSYQAKNVVRYTANTAYRFQIDVDLGSRRFSVWVRPVGGSAMTQIADQWAFRTVQPATTMANWAATVDSSSGTMRVCDVQISKDQFGISKLFRSLPGGRQWFSNWNGRTYDILPNQWDSDGQLQARGGGTIRVKDGIATLVGKSPRMYVHDSAGIKKWGDVEITFYIRLLEGAPLDESQAGAIAGARSEHQRAEKAPSPNSCFGTTYYGRLMMSGRLNFQKEWQDGVEPGGYVNDDDSRLFNGWLTGKMPRGQWIGYKFVIRNEQPSQVTMRLYVDQGNGANGGQWKEVLVARDPGVTAWATYPRTATDCGFYDGQAYLGPSTSVFIRNTGFADAPLAEYRAFSIREVVAE